MGEYWIYMLCCADNTLYTGIAKDVKKRFHEHNHSPRGARYTRARRPVELLYLEAAEDRSCALKREAAIKKYSRHEKLALIDAQHQLSCQHAAQLELTLCAMIE